MSIGLPANACIATASCRLSASRPSRSTSMMPTKNCSKNSMPRLNAARPKLQVLRPSALKCLCDGTDLRRPLDTLRKGQRKSFRGSSPSQVILGSRDRCIERKEGACDEPMRLGCLAPPNGGNGLGALVAIVTKHNESCAEFQPVVALARELIEADFIANRLEDYRDIKEEIDRRRLEQAEARERADKIRSEISELEAGSTRPSASGGRVECGLARLPWTRSVASGSQ